MIPTRFLSRRLICALIALPGGFVALPAGAAEPAPTTRPAKKLSHIAESERFFNEGPIPRLHIEIAPAELEALKKTPRAYVHATIRESAPGEPDRIYKDVAAHLKGSYGSFRGVDDKPAFTVSFTRFDKSSRFHGLSKINLNNSVQDPSFLCENLGGFVFRSAGLAAPRITNARVWLNGRDLGMFVLKDTFDDLFLRRFFHTRDGTVYEGTLIDVDQPLRTPANQSQKKPERLKELAAAASEPDPALRRQKLEKILDVDEFLSYIAIEAMIVHWDGYSGNRNNYRIYDNPVSGRLVFLPHGMDQVFQRPDHPLFQGASMVARAFFQTPEEKSRYFDRVAELRRKAFDPETIARRLDAISARILPVLAEISPDAERQHKELAAALRQRLFDRARNIDQQLAGAPRLPRFDAAGVAALTAWNPVSAGTQSTLQRVEKDGQVQLQIRNADAPAPASFRTAVLLEKGKYTLEATCTTSGVIAPDGPNTGAGLRISGAQRPTRLIGNTPAQKIRFDFEIAEPSREVVLVAELNASRGEATFTGLSLRRH